MIERKGTRLIVSGLFLYFTFTFFSSCQSKEVAVEREISLDRDWLIQAAEKVDVPGEKIAGPHFDLTGWRRTDVPSTVLGALFRNGEVEEPFLGKRLEQIGKERFAGPWWYRKEFSLPRLKSFPHVRLCFNGINYRADVWLNGKKIGSKEEIFGSFRVFELDVSDIIRPGKNFLAVEIFPPQPGDFTIGFVDWNPEPPDKNMGIWRPVVLRLSGPVSIDNPFVQTDVNVETLAEASLVITAELVNHTEEAIDGTLQAELEAIALTQRVRLEPGERKTARFDAETFDELRLRHPRLWWPHPWGEQNFYELRLKFLHKGGVSDERKVTFGIREVSDYINEEGHRGFKINGRPILIRGGGWVDDIFLADDDRKLEAKLGYTRHMNLNAIRLEGFWGTSHRLYDLCDRLGILIMAGWSCQWEWDSHAGKRCDEYGGIQTPEEKELIARSFRDQVVLWRNHPSVFVWLVGSDKLPRPELERKYHAILTAHDPTRPVLGAAKGLTSEVSGPTRVKMNGPYDYVPPVYWFEDKKYGGAFGFNTETGPGPQPPPLESLKKMIPGDHLWPIDDVWNFHCARGMFKTLKRYIEALERRYGKLKDVHDFIRKAQVANYEAMRAMFEAFVAHKHRSTGVIQWMLNAAWPKLYWQLYDYYLMPNGAFYGARKAGQPLHLLYHYHEKCVYAANDYLEPRRNLRASIRAIDLQSREIFKREIQFDIEANSSTRLAELSGIPVRGPVYFLDLRLEDDRGKMVSQNFYWLPARQDVLDYRSTTWFVTPIKEFADLRALESLPMVKLDVEWHFEPSESEGKAIVKLNNPTETIAFFVEVRVQKKRSDSAVLPIYWDDNYISLLPGESRTLEGEFHLEDLDGEEPEVVVSGWNVESETKIAATAASVQNFGQTINE